MFSIILLTHTIAVNIFIIFLLIKSYYLFRSKTDTLAKFSQRIKIPNIIISVLLLLSGLYLWFYSGTIGIWFFVKLVAVILSIPLAVMAFRKNSRLLAGASLLLLIYAYGVSETRSPDFQKKPVGMSLGEAAGDLADGKSIYETYCQSCHGHNGKLELSGARDLTRSTISFNEIIKVIDQGAGTMPAYNNILSQEQVENVARYVEQLRQQND